MFPRANHRFEESSRRIIRDWVLGSRYQPELYDTLAARLSRRIIKELSWTNNLQIVR